MEYWQAFEADAAPPPHAADAPVAMPDGSALRLPLRDYGEVAVTGFIANQASFPVLRRVAAWMTAAARPLGAEVVLGLPTLGHVVAAPVAEALGHPNWVAAGTSRKRWYDDALSAPLTSSTTPAERRLYLDPRVLGRLRGRRILLVDDVISSGSSARAGVALLAAAGLRPAALLVAMAQGDRWRADWPADIPVAAAFATPLYRRGAGGWFPDEATRPPVLLPPVPLPR